MVNAKASSTQSLIAIFSNFLGTFKEPRAMFHKMKLMALIINTYNPYISIADTVCFEIMAIDNMHVSHCRNCYVGVKNH